jgi:hypothetical protein
MTDGFTTSQGQHPIEGWNEAFKEKFMSEIDRIVSAMESDKIDVGRTGETGNFGLKVYASLQWNCDPCNGPNIRQTQTLIVYFKLYDPVLMLEVDAFSVEKTWPLDLSGPSAWLDRTWSEFFRNIQENNRVSDWVGKVTSMKNARLTFKPKKLGEKKPMEADGKKHGYIKIEQIVSSKTKYPVGENPNNPLTRYRLSVKHGYLIDQGNEVKSIDFSGDEFITKRNNFEYEYRVYECNCEKYEEFELKLIEQNGASVEQVVETLKEEFKCYGYTLLLDYRETNDLTGTTKIMATWECFRVNFGNPGEKPAEMDPSSLGSGQAIDTNGDPLLPPYTIPMAIEDGLIHVSAPIKNNSPATYNLSVSPGGLIEPATHLHINVSEEYLTNPPELILVKAPVDGTETCGGMVPPGVYLEWQFDVWGNLPELGLSQLYSPAASMCPLLSNIPNSTTARVPESAVAAMKEGKAFTFSNSNDFGTYTITGIPQQQ